MTGRRQRTETDFESRKAHVREILHALKRGNCALTEEQVRRAMDDDKKLTRLVRQEEFEQTFCNLFDNVNRTEFFSGDKTQPLMKDIVYFVVRESGWRLAEATSFEVAEEIVSGAFEVVESEFHDTSGTVSTSGENEDAARQSG